jgi:hypothetical protein
MAALFVDGGFLQWMFSSQVPQIRGGEKRIPLSGLVQAIEEELIVSFKVKVCVLKEDAGNAEFMNALKEQGVQCVVVRPELNEESAIASVFATKATVLCCRANQIQKFVFVAAKGSFDPFLSLLTSEGKEVFFVASAARPTERDLLQFASPHPRIPSCQGVVILESPIQDNVGSAAPPQVAQQLKEPKEVSAPKSDPLADILAGFLDPIKEPTRSDDVPASDPIVSERRTREPSPQPSAPQLSTPQTNERLHSDEGSKSKKSQPVEAVPEVRVSLPLNTSMHFDHTVRRFYFASFDPVSGEQKVSWTHPEGDEAQRNLEEQVNVWYEGQKQKRKNEKDHIAAKNDAQRLPGQIVGVEPKRMQPPPVQTSTLSYQMPDPGVYRNLNIPQQNVQPRPATVPIAPPRPIQTVNQPQPQPIALHPSAPQWATPAAVPAATAIERPPLSQPPLPSGDEALPPGWERRLDQASGKFYYVDHNTMRTSWTRPPS